MAEPRSGPDAVLVPTGRQMKSYACLRSLHRRGIDTVVASEHETIPHFASRFCSERRRLPSPWEDLVAYKDALLEIAARPEVKTIFPVREADVYVFAKYHDEFAEHVSLAAPDLDSLSTAHDRLRLARAAEAAGVPYAETRLLSEVDEWDSSVVVKSRYNVLTGEYLDSYPEGRLEEVNRVTTLPAGDSPDPEALRAAMGHDPIVQEFVPQADKHLYCALWDDGEPLATYQHRQLRQNSWVGGGGVYRVSVHSRTVEDLAYDLLSHLEWDGVACIEYVEDERTGEWKFLEINPRLWQSLPEAVRAGADFPYYYWQLVRGEAERIDLEYEDGIACHNMYGEVAHLLSVLRDDSPLAERPSFVRTLAAIVASSVGNPRFDYIRLDDPGLFLSGIRDTLSTGVSRSRNFDSRSDSSQPRVSSDGGTSER